MDVNEDEIRKKIAEEIQAEIPILGPRKNGKIYCLALMHAVDIILKEKEK